MNLPPTLPRLGSDERNPLPWLQRAAVVLAVLGFLGVAIDITFMSPLFRAAWLAMVTPHLERDWGFHAERREIRDVNRLVIASVVPGGAFDRAGIKPGWVVWDRGCTICAMSGGMYGALGRAKDKARLAFWEEDPSMLRKPTTVLVERKLGA